MADPVRIVVEGVPIPYSERTTVWRGRVGSKRPAVLVAWQKAIAWAARDEMVHRTYVRGPILLECRFFMPIPKQMRVSDRRLAEQGLLWHTKRPDRTNLIKAAEDALNMVVWADDGQVCAGSATKRYSTRPRIEIMVTTLPRPDPSEAPDK